MPIKTLVRSLRLIISNFGRYLLIYLLTSLPLALTQSSLSLTLHPYRLRPSAALHLILSRFLLSLPFLLPLSLLSSTSSISTTFSLLSSPASSLPPLLSNIRRFPRVLATSICAHALTWLYLSLASLVLYSLPEPASFLLRVIAWAGRAHLMAAMSVAVVATVASPEVDVGWGAMREGWRAVGRRWWCAWSATVALQLGIEGIWGGILFKRMDGQDWSGVVGLGRWMAGIGWRAWMVALYGFLVLLSYVVYTVFYFDYRKACPCPPHGGEGNGDDGPRDRELQMQGGGSSVLK